MKVTKNGYSLLVYFGFMDGESQIKDKVAASNSRATFD